MECLANVKEKLIIRSYLSSVLAQKALGIVAAADDRLGRSRKKLSKLLGTEFFIVIQLSFGNHFLELIISDRPTTHSFIKVQGFFRRNLPIPILVNCSDKVLAAAYLGQLVGVLVQLDSKSDTNKAKGAGKFHHLKSLMFLLFVY